MHKKLLDKFFRENEEGDISAQLIAHMFLSSDNNVALKEEFKGIMEKERDDFEPERLKAIEAEFESINSATTYEQIVKILRSYHAPVNQEALINKALEFEEDIVPEIIRRYKTNLNDRFVETSIRILARSRFDTANEIAGYYDDIRSPYAQSLALVLLGFKADESLIPWLIEKYYALKKNYPNESYCEGAYYALLEIEDRHPRMEE